MVFSTVFSWPLFSKTFKKMFVQKRCSFIEILFFISSKNSSQMF